MIDFRYHLVSLISVFLALAVGIVLGAGPLKEAIGDQLTGQVESLRADKEKLRADLDEAATDLAQRELAAIYRSDLNLMISEYEIDLLVEQFHVPAALLHWCPLMVDKVPSEFVPFEQRQHFLSIGNFRHAPNWDAVLWMKTQVWPLIRQQLPDAQLHIYGAYTPPKATALPTISCASRKAKPLRTR